MFQVIHYTLIIVLTIYIRFFFIFPDIVLECLVTFVQGKIGDICDIFGKLKQNNVICMAVARAIQYVLHLLGCQQW